MHRARNYLSTVWVTLVSRGFHLDMQVGFATRTVVLILLVLIVSLYISCGIPRAMEAVPGRGLSNQFSTELTNSVTTIIRHKMYYRDYFVNHLVFGSLARPVFLLRLAQGERRIKLV